MRTPTLEATARADRRVARGDVPCAQASSWAARQSVCAPGGLLFNWIGGNATLTDITLHDVDPGAPGVYVVRNTIRRNLSCFGLDPGVSGGFIPGEVNVVGRHAIGQCASLV